MPQQYLRSQSNFPTYVEFNHAKVFLSCKNFFGHAFFAKYQKVGSLVKQSLANYIAINPSEYHIYYIAY